MSKFCKFCNGVGFVWRNPIGHDFTRACPECNGSGIAECDKSPNGHHEPILQGSYSFGITGVSDNIKMVNICRYCNRRIKNGKNR